MGNESQCALVLAAVEHAPAGLAHLKSSGRERALSGRKASLCRAGANRSMDQISVPEVGVQ